MSFVIKRLEEMRDKEIEKSLNNYFETKDREHLNDVHRINIYYDNLILEQTFEENKLKNYS